MGFSLFYNSMMQRLLNFHYWPEAETLLTYTRGLGPLRLKLQPDVSM